MNLNIKIISGVVILLIAFALTIWRLSLDDVPSTPAIADQGNASAAASRDRIKRPALTPPVSSSGLPETEAGDESPAVSEARAAAREAVLEKIHEAATTYDPAELPVIRPYLVSADPELREAAVDAMIVLGDAAAGPMLREAAARMESAEEAKAMLEAADYVELPPADLKELMKRSKERPDGALPPKRRKK